jgi:hypothetical protein
MIMYSDSSHSNDDDHVRHSFEASDVFNVSGFLPYFFFSIDVIGVD